MFSKIKKVISSLDIESIPEERKEILQPLIDYILNKRGIGEEIRLNFICTHNSRRSHLAQIWAQVMAENFKIKKVKCFSGGTEATALYTSIKKTLEKEGFKFKLAVKGQSPNYQIFFSKKGKSINGFSKTFDHSDNPTSNFAAVMTCSQADENCPFIIGADKRISVTYEDPKAYDNTSFEKEKYKERSLQIATEMKYVFSKIKEE